jgi:hypothetical protein
MRSFFIGVARRAASAVFAADDQLARDRGWQIRTGRLALSRSYRHPGFDRLATCTKCQGSGRRHDAGCRQCAGTGRVTIRRPGSGREEVMSHAAKSGQ